MTIGDYFQYPKEDPFNLPQGYNLLKKEARKEKFWVKMMEAGQPFKFAEVNELTSKPICWTNKPALLSDILDISEQTIEEIQKTLLYHSLKNSVPV